MAVAAAAAAAVIHRRESLALSQLPMIPELFLAQEITLTNHLSSSKVAILFTSETWCGYMMMEEEQEEEEEGGEGRQEVKISGKDHKRQAINATPVALLSPFFSC